MVVRSAYQGVEIRAFELGTYDARHALWIAGGRVTFSCWWPQRLTNATQRLHWQYPPQPHLLSLVSGWVAVAPIILFFRTGEQRMMRMMVADHHREWEAQRCKPSSYRHLAESSEVIVLSAACSLTAPEIGIKHAENPVGERLVIDDDFGHVSVEVLLLER